MTDDEKDEQLYDMERGRKVKFMTQHPGWSEIVGPELARWRESLMTRLLRENLKPEEFTLVRQSINAHDALVEFIKSIMRRGEMAQEEIEKKKKPDEETED